MDYIKFNCYDLAAQDTELYNAYSRIQILTKELAGVLNTLDPQIKSYENLQHQLMTVQNKTTDISARILTAHNMLDQIIDLYHAAESKVKQTVEKLPVDYIESTTSPSNSRMGEIQTASINRGDLILEDWLAELLYRGRKDKNDGQ